MGCRYARTLPSGSNCSSGSAAKPPPAGSHILSCRSPLTTLHDSSRCRLSAPTVLMPPGTLTVWPPSRATRRVPTIPVRFNHRLERKVWPPSLFLRGKLNGSKKLREAPCKCETQTRQDQIGLRVVRECVRTTFFVSCVFACVCAGACQVPSVTPWTATRRGKDSKDCSPARRRLTCRRHSAAPWPPSAAAPPSPRPRPRSERPCPLRPGSLEGQRQRHRRLWAGTRAHATGQPLRPPGGGGSPLGP